MFLKLCVCKILCLGHPFTPIPDLQFSSEIQFEQNFLKNILTTLDMAYARMC